MSERRMTERLFAEILKFNLLARKVAYLGQTSNLEAARNSINTLYLSSTFYLKVWKSLQLLGVWRSLQIKLHINLEHYQSQWGSSKMVAHMVLYDYRRDCEVALTPLIQGAAMYVLRTGSGAGRLCLWLSLCWDPAVGNWAGLGSF